MILTDECTNKCNNKIFKHCSNKPTINHLHNNIVEHKYKICSESFNCCLKNSCCRCCCYKTITPTKNNYIHNNLNNKNKNSGSVDCGNKNDTMFLYCDDDNNKKLKNNATVNRQHHNRYYRNNTSMFNTNLSSLLFLIVVIAPIYLNGIFCQGKK